MDFGRGGLVVLVLAIAALCGCLTTKTAEDCDAIKDTVDDPSLFTEWGRLDSCYHEAAMGYAIRGENQTAIETCNKIDPDSNVLGESERNNCLADIAQIIKDPAICELLSNGILDPSGDGGKIAGVWPTFKEQCIRKATVS